MKIHHDAGHRANPCCAHRERTVVRERWRPWQTNDEHQASEL